MSEEYGGDFITLTDDEGNEFELELLDSLEHNGIDYMAFIRADTPEDAEEVEIIILKDAGEEGEEILATLDDDDELEEIYALFMERIAKQEEEDAE